MYTLILTEGETTLLMRCGGVCIRNVVHYYKSNVMVVEGVVGGLGGRIQTVRVGDISRLFRVRIVFRSFGRGKARTHGCCAHINKLYIVWRDNALRT